MDTEYFVIFLLIITGLLLLVQRSEPSKRRLVIVLLILPAILLRNFALYREMETEALTALWVAIILNFLYWLLLGRHIPVRGSEQIKVLGMDD